MNPTLWRTCRVLAGKTRIGILRDVVGHAGLTVSDLAARSAISLSRASQELRRLQSRGLVQAVREGPVVKYRPIPDPQVPAAKPLLLSLKDSFRRFPPTADSEIIRIAVAFSHARRLAIVRALLQEPRNLRSLGKTTRMPRASLLRHLRILRVRGLMISKGDHYCFVAGTHPLVRCLTRLLQQPPIPC